jgi:LysR family transcriptional activator of nhaA
MRQMASLELDVILTDSVPNEQMAVRGLEHRVVHTARMLAVAAPRTMGQIGSFQEGATGFAMLHYTTGSRARQDVDAYLASRSMTPRIVGEADDVGVMVRAALEGIAAVVVPETAVEDHLTRGALVMLGEIEGLSSVVRAVYQHQDAPERVLEAIERLTQPNVGRIAA